MAPLLCLRPGAPGRKHQLPTDSKPAEQPVGWWAAGQAGGCPRASGWANGGVPVLTGGTRGNPSMLHACNIQPSSEPVGSPASVGASAEPLEMGSPVWGWTDSGGCRAQACPLSYRSPG